MIAGSSSSTSTSANGGSTSRASGAYASSSAKSSHHDDRYARVVNPETLDALAIGDEHLGLAVVEEVADLGAGRPPVQADGDRTQADRRPERDHPLGAIRAEDRDAIARLHVEAIAKRRGDRRDQPCMLGITEPALVDAVGGEHVGVVAEVDRLHEQIAQRADAVLERADHHAVDFDVDDLERCALGEQRRLDARYLFRYDAFLGNIDRRHSPNL